MPDVRLPLDEDTQTRAGRWRKQHYRGAGREPATGNHRHQTGSIAGAKQREDFHSSVKQSSVRPAGSPGTGKRAASVSAIRAPAATSTNPSQHDHAANDEEHYRHHGNPRVQNAGNQDVQQGADYG